MAHSKHTSILEIIFNCVTKFSTCCLSLIVHLDDDLFVSVLNATFHPSSAASHDFFVWAPIFLFFFLSFFLSRPWGQKSQVLASCAGWSISRSGKPSFISLTNSGPLSFLLCRRVPIARFRENASGRKKWPTLSSWDMYFRRTRVVYLKKCHEYWGYTVEIAR